MVRVHRRLQCIIRQVIVWCDTTSRHQSAREGAGENKKIIKIIIFDSRAYRQDRSQGLKKGKSKHSRI